MGKPALYLSYYYYYYIIIIIIHQRINIIITDFVYIKLYQHNLKEMHSCHMHNDRLTSNNPTHFVGMLTDEQYSYIICTYADTQFPYKISYAYFQWFTAMTHSPAKNHSIVTQQNSWHCKICVHLIEWNFERQSHTPHLSISRKVIHVKMYECLIWSKNNRVSDIGTPSQAIWHHYTLRTCSFVFITKLTAAVNKVFHLNVLKREIKHFKRNHFKMKGMLTGVVS